jgi:hypothetical protein
MGRKRGRGGTRKTKLKTRLKSKKRSRRRNPKKRVGKRKTHRRKLKGVSAEPRPRKVSLEDILKSGKVYKLENIKYDYDYDADPETMTIKMGTETVTLTRDVNIYKGDNTEIYKLKLGVNEIPVILKIIMGDPEEPDLSESFFSKVFRHIPDFNDEWVEGDGGEFRNCGVVQSYYAGSLWEEQHMLLETGLTVGKGKSVMDLNKWILINKDIPLEQYVILSTKILWQIIGQIVCLQEYGAFFFDIKSANILVIQSGDWDVRALLIDTGGTIYHVPTFEAKINTLPNPNKEVIQKVLKDHSVVGSGYLYIKNNSTDEFPSSMAPLFLGATEGGVVSPTNLEAGHIFNIFSVSLLANELVCRDRNEEGGKMTRRSRSNFKGLYWRGYNDQGKKPKEVEKTKLLEYLVEFEASIVFGELITLFLKNWEYFRGLGVFVIDTDTTATYLKDVAKNMLERDHRLLFHELFL